MNCIRFKLLLALFTVNMAAFAEPVPVIFDTDMDTDVDDVGALLMLHTLADAGEARILATVVSSHFKYSAPCVDAINRYRGRQDIPVGAPKGKGASTSRGSKYARQIADEFPCRFRTNDDVPAATEVYRRILAGEPDNSITIVTVGYLTNLRDLLETGPDKYSKLNGNELVRQKVARWICMGGRYPEHLDPGVYGNFKPDPEAAVTAVNNWPGAIHFSGLGMHILTGQSLRKAPLTNPGRRAYDLYLGSKAARPSWDQVVVLYGVRPNASYWTLLDKGCNHIFNNGTNQWREEPDKDHFLLQYADGARQRVRDVIENLMSTPPPVNK